MDTNNRALNTDNSFGDLPRPPSRQISRRPEKICG